MRPVAVCGFVMPCDELLKLSFCEVNQKQKTQKNVTKDRKVFSKLRPRRPLHRPAVKGDCA